MGKLGVAAAVLLCAFAVNRWMSQQFAVAKQVIAPEQNVIPSD
jgi:hypothetical protein